MARKMSDAHKQALAEGRKYGRAVRSYLEALEASKPKRGRKRTAASIQARLDAIEETIHEASPLNRLQIVQERMDLEGEKAGLEGDSSIDMAKLEADFIESAPRTARARTSPTRRGARSG